MKRVASPTRQAPANDPKKNRISSPETGQNNPAVQDVQTSVLKSQSAEFPVKITLKLKKPSSDASVIHSQKTAVSPVGAPVAPQALISQDKENMATKRQLDKMQLKPEQRAFVEKLIMDARKRGAACKSIVVNDARLLSTPEGVAEKFLGHVIYTGAKSCNLYSNRGADLQLFLLPEFSLANHYSTIQVRIPAEYLSYRGNIAVRKSALWGTDVYTDDSDVVAMIIHSGHYRPVDAPDPTPEESQLIDKSIAGHLEASTAARNPISTPVQPLVAGAEPIVKGSHIMYPDHDLHVLLRVLPRLVKYAGSTRFGLDSRAWGTSHDGESVQVVKVERIARGSVGKQGRKVFSKQWGDLAKSVTKDSEDLAFPDGDYTHRNPEHEDDTTVVFSQVDGGAW